MSLVARLPGLVLRSQCRQRSKGHTIIIESIHAVFLCDLTRDPLSSRASRSDQFFGVESGYRCSHGVVHRQLLMDRLLGDAGFDAGKRVRAQLMSELGSAADVCTAGGHRSTWIGHTEQLTGPATDE